ncbi:transporter substrate-binding domain-containing protein [Paucibacter sp. DJ1R-11]|uniref:substrate-binding periplasmic protein n=1 Tax=Paucibacter sp. DJ1R-11 TaxID=2893556 RepID=UPI0021E4C9E2|nr:transporter substrate-binding domain-containing protein [Paucibacter sp. DJ1R-11]MCV2363170.1 transporter substrate-binding domain-containing protein [Paucibacter sp. DJ1R-11]
MHAPAPPSSSPSRPGTRRKLMGQLLLSVGLWAGLAVLSSSGARAAPAETRCSALVASGNPQYPPYLWRDPADESRLIGANADLMQMLAQELGLAIELRYVGPWGRVQEEAKAGRIDMIAGAFWTQARTEYMDYFTPAFHQTRSVIWVGDKSRLNYSHWSDLVGQQGVTVINNSFGEAFDRYAKQSLKISQVASLEQAIQMLQRGRASYLIYEDSPGQAFLAKLDIHNVKMLSPAVANENLHLTLSHKSPCNTGELRGRIARAMHKLGGASVLPELLEKNIQLWRQQSPLVK